MPIDPEKAKRIQNSFNARVEDKKTARDQENEREAARKYAEAKAQELRKKKASDKLAGE